MSLESWSLKRLSSGCIPFLPLPRLTGGPRSCLGFRRGLWCLCRWGSGLGERGTRPGILPGAPGLPFGTSRQGLVGGRETIRRDTEVRDELDEELVPFGRDGTAGGGARRRGRQAGLVISALVGCSSFPPSQDLLASPWIGGPRPVLVPSRVSCLVSH